MCWAMPRGRMIAVVVEVFAVFCGIVVRRK